MTTSEFYRKVPFASKDAHSIGTMRSEASLDAEAFLRIGGLSEKSLPMKGGDNKDKCFRLK